MATFRQSPKLEVIDHYGRSLGTIDPNEPIMSVDAADIIALAEPEVIPEAPSEPVSDFADEACDRCHHSILVCSCPAEPVSVPSVPSENPLPFNPTTGQPYGGKNIERLLMAELEHGYGAGGWAGFKQWISVGRVVRKGERECTERSRREGTCSHCTHIVRIGATKTENADGSVSVKSHPVGNGRVFHFDQTTELEEARSDMSCA